MAWVVARLAEALDHAFSRDVAHGDIKPSNILLSADGNPMLLDFNLARDGSPAGSSWSDNDPGGTLAYMAPERLRKLATADPTGDGSRSGRSFSDSDVHSNTSPTQASDLLDRGPHLADIYALGMVLLETLTARAARADHDCRRSGLGVFLQPRQEGRNRLFGRTRAERPGPDSRVRVGRWPPDPGRTCARSWSAVSIRTRPSATDEPGNSPKT